MTPLANSLTDARLLCPAEGLPSMVVGLQDSPESAQRWWTQQHSVFVCEGYGREALKQLATLLIGGKAGASQQEVGTG